MREKEETEDKRKRGKLVRGKECGGEKKNEDTSWVQFSLPTGGGVTCLCYNRGHAILSGHPCLQRRPRTPALMCTSIRRNQKVSVACTLLVGCYCKQTHHTTATKLTLHSKLHHWQSLELSRHRGGYYEARPVDLRPTFVLHILYVLFIRIWIWDWNVLKPLNSDVVYVYAFIPITYIKLTTGNAKIPSLG